MLYRFIVQNFKSFRDRNEISFYPKGQEPPRHIADADSEIPVLKTAVLYGPNASGKTKFIQAIDFARSIILGELNILSVPNHCYRLDKESINNPSLFVFEIKIETHLFQYAFALDMKNSSVVEESLSIWNADDNSFCNIYYREQDTSTAGTDIINFNDDLIDVDKVVFDVFKSEIEKTQETLALTVLARVKSLLGTVGTYVKKVYKWFSDLVILFPSTRYNLLGAVRNGTEEANLVYKSYFKTFGIDIKEIALQKVNSEMLQLPSDMQADIKKGLSQLEGNDGVAQLRSRKTDYLLRLNEDKELEAYEVRFVHERNALKTSLSKIDESDGTMRLFDFIPLYAMLADESRVVLIDEIDRSMHTLLTRYLIEQFFKAAEGKNSQLICTTHDVMLLSENLFANSEVWFVNKEDEVSTIYPLSKYNLSKLPVNLERNYLLGRFDAIPKF